MARRPSSGSVALQALPDATRQNGPTLPPTPKRPSAQPTDIPRRPSARSTSSSQKLDSLANMSGMDPDDLFARHSNVVSWTVVNSMHRADADAKQEELRLMVGERYRDLLQASTSILALAKSSKHVLTALEEMRDTVNAISSVRASKRTATGEDKHLQALQSLSAHVKLLLDAPEHLWRLMERKSYLNAAWLFLLARVVHRALSQEDDDQSWQAYGIDVMEQMPLVQRQWDTITPFRSQISHRATLSLREPDSSPGEVCATLLTLHLLESRPLPETLSIYLAQRTKTLSGMLNRTASTSANGDAKPNGKGPHRPRKVAVRETKQKVEAVLDAIARTVHTARCMFADSESSSPPLMKLALQFFQAPSDDPGALPTELQLSTQILLTTLPSSSHFLLLPQSIRTYKPYIDGAAVMTPTLQPHLRDKLESWFKRAVQDARSAVADWFAGLDSVREVWDVRTSLLSWLKGADGLESPERHEIESIIDSACQNQATSVWRGALDALVSSFRDAIDSATQALEQAGNENPYDMRPIEHLFHASSIPSILQAGVQSSAAAIQFAKYKSTLRQQLAGRTPLLEAAMTVLERHASDIQRDLAVMLKTGENGSSLVGQLSTCYRADAQASAAKICEVLGKSAAGHESSSRSSLFVARICQELTSSSDFFPRVGCSPSSIEVSREQLSSLYLELMQSWQEKIVARILKENLIDSSGRSQLATDAALPTRPSPALTQALLSLSSELQQLGVCLDDDRRKRQAGSTLRRFTAAYLDVSEQDAIAYAPGLQALWDLIFLQMLDQLWSDENSQFSDRIATTITRQQLLLSSTAASSPSMLATTVREYLSRTQNLFAGLLPSPPPREAEPTTPSSKSEKPSSLLHYGTPAIEQRFEPALDLVKTPPRFGLLLVGGTTVR
ncbi:hypothetical protein C8Q76DRAFT_710587 [Earliella scabrosa]|nr:hypothetical protein C8Q76DRAFT_710587 [Earliella scabrosa]